MPTEEEIAAAKAAEEDAAKKAAKEKEAGKKGGVEYTMEQVVQGMQHLHATNQALMAKVGTLEAAAAKKPAPPAKSGEEDEKINLETMTRSEFMGHMLKAVEKNLVEPVKAAQAKGEEKRFNSEAKGQIERAASNHEDFWEFKDEIKVIVDEHPNIDIEEAYILARSRNKDKASLIDAKAAEKAEADKKEAEKKEEKTPKYGGLLPTSGSTKRTQHMNAGDAAEAAWEELGIGEHISAISSN